MCILIYNVCLCNTHFVNESNKLKIIGGILLHIFSSDTFKSTTNSDTLEKQKYQYLVVLFNVPL